MDGILFFPVTPFDEAGRVDSQVLEEHIGSRLPFEPGAVFPACGTGEFHALSALEVGRVVSTAVSVVHGRSPVVSGVGGPLPHAIECARLAQAAGADAILILPPYLVSGGHGGTLAYISAILDSTDLPAIVYHRGTAALSLDNVKRLLDDNRVVGFKDGVGDIALAQAIALLVRESGRADVLLFNGLLTAELSQLAYRAIGVPLYSSAVFAMAPDIAASFYAAYNANDNTHIDALMRSFYVPLVSLRDEVPGFAVSLIKAGLRLEGLDVGGVRPSLMDPDPRQSATLDGIIHAGRDELRA